MMKKQEKFEIINVRSRDKKRFIELWRHWIGDLYVGVPTSQAEMFAIMMDVCRATGKQKVQVIASRRVKK